MSYLRHEAGGVRAVCSYCGKVSDAIGKGQASLHKLLLRDHWAIKVGRVKCGTCRGVRSIKECDEETEELFAGLDCGTPEETDEAQAPSGKAKGRF